MQRIPHQDCPNLMFANEPQQTPQILAPALAPQRQQWLCGRAQRVRKSDTYPHLPNIQSHHSPRNHDPPHLSPSGTSLSPPETEVPHHLALRYLKPMCFAEPVKLIMEKPCPRILFHCAETSPTERAWKNTGQMLRQHLRTFSPSRSYPTLRSKSLRGIEGCEASCFC